MTTFYAAILLLPLADGMTLFFLNPCLTGRQGMAMTCSCPLALHQASIT